MCYFPSRRSAYERTAGSKNRKKVISIVRAENGENAVISVRTTIRYTNFHESVIFPLRPNSVKYRR